MSAVHGGNRQQSGHGPFYEAAEQITDVDAGQSERSVVHIGDGNSGAVLIWLDACIEQAGVPVNCLIDRAGELRPVHPGATPGLAHDLRDQILDAVTPAELSSKYAP